MIQTMTAPRLRDANSLARLFETREPGQSLEKVFGTLVSSEDRKSTTLAPALQSTFALPTPGKEKLACLSELSEPQTLTLEEIKGTLTNFRHSLNSERLGMITLTLPLGLDHYFVNAATFKALAGRDQDTLLRQAGERWKIVEDNEAIDLGDRSQVFKLGKVQIYS